LRSSLSSIPDAVIATPFHDVHHRGFWPKQLMVVWSLHLQSGSEGYPSSLVQHDALAPSVFVTQCQFQTHAPQQVASLFDRFVGASDERKGKGDAKGL
jgi:hypothetical protein